VKSADHLGYVRERGVSIDIPEGMMKSVAGESGETPDFSRVFKYQAV